MYAVYICVALCANIVSEKLEPKLRSVSQYIITVALTEGETNLCVLDITSKFELPAFCLTTSLKIRDPLQERYFPVKSMSHVLEKILMFTC